MIFNMPRTDIRKHGKKKKTRNTTFLKGHLPWNKDQQSISSVPCTEPTCQYPGVSSGDSSV